MSNLTFNKNKVQLNFSLWIVLPIATAAQLSQALPRMGLPVLYPFIQDEFGLSRAQVGIITSSLAIGFGAVVLLAGYLIDNFGVKRMITISLLSFAALTFSFPLAYSFHFVLAVVVLIAITAGPVQPATTTVIMDWIPRSIRGLAMSIKQMGVPIAGALTAALLPALTLALGWRMAAASTGLFILAIAITFILLYRDAPREIQTARKFNLTPLKNILRNRVLIITILWGAAFSGFQFTTLSYFMLFIIEEIGLSPIMAGGMLAIAQFSSIIARVAWGAVSDFIFHGRRIVVLAISGLLTVLWMLGASLTGAGINSAAVYLITIAIGISTLSFHGVFLTLIGEQAEAGQVGTTTGLTMTLSHIGMMVMPPLFGYLVDVTSSYSLAWRVAAASALVCTLALLVFGKEQ
jgi:ACS family hexuronate transporter-like MFS transporter